MGTIADLLNTAMRDFVRYSGDGLPGEPVGRPLPVGDPASGQFNPPKKQVRNALIAIAETADGAAADRVQTGLDRQATQADAAVSLTYRDQAQVAAIAAGAPLVTTLTDPVPSEDTVEILQTDVGAQVWEVTGGIWVLLGFLFTPKYDNVSGLEGADYGFAPGTLISIGFGNSIVKAVASGGTIANASGQEFVVVTAPTFASRNAEAIAEIDLYPAGTLGMVGAEYYISGTGSGAHEETLALGIVPTATYSTSDPLQTAVIQAAQTRIGANGVLHFALPAGWEEAHYNVGNDYNWARSWISADKGVIIHSPNTSDDAGEKPRLIGRVVFSEESAVTSNAYRTDRGRNDYTPLDAIAGALALTAAKVTDERERCFLTRDARPIRFSSLASVSGTVDGSGMSISNTAVSWADGAAAAAAGTDWQGMEFACCEGSEVEILLSNSTGTSGLVHFGVKAVGAGGTVTADTFQLELSTSSLKYYNGNTLVQTFTLDHLGMTLKGTNGRVRVAIRINKKLNSFSVLLNDRRFNIPVSLSRIAHSIIVVADQAARATVKMARALFVERTLATAPDVTKVTFAGDSKWVGARSSNEAPTLVEVFATHMGIGRIEATNISVSGDRLASFVARIADYDFTGQDVVGTALGVNDFLAAGPGGAGDFETGIQTWGNKIVADGAKPFFIAQSMFGYTALSGGPAGITTYQFAEYQNILKNKCMENGWAFGDASEFFGSNYPRAGAFATSQITPAWMHDIIHDNTAGQIANAQAAISAMMRLILKPVQGALCARLPLQNAFTIGLEASAGEPRIVKRGSRVELQGVVAGGVANTVLGTLGPDWAQCPRTLPFRCSAGGAFGFQGYTLDVRADGNIVPRNDYPSGVLQGSIQCDWSL